MVTTLAFRQEEKYILRINILYFDFSRSQVEPYDHLTKKVMAVYVNGTSVAAQNRHDISL